MFFIYHKNEGRNHTWSQDESLDEMLARKEEIKENFYAANKAKRSLNLLDAVLDDEDDGDDGCLVCFK